MKYTVKLIEEDPFLEPKTDTYIINADLYYIIKKGCMMQGEKEQ